MGIFSKIFGGDKLELTDDTQKSPVSEEQTSDEIKENKEPSPFLVENEEKKEIKND